MLRVMSPEEVARSERRVKALTDSENPVDNVMAILMDSSLGGTGLYEEVAKSKAIAILTIIHLPKLDARKE